MKLKIRRQDGDAIVSLLTEDGEVPFSYITLIDHLYRGNDLEPTEYSEDITQDERTALTRMIDRIIAIISVEAGEDEGGISQGVEGEDERPSETEENVPF